MFNQLKEVVEVTLGSWLGRRKEGWLAVSLLMNKMGANDLGHLEGGLQESPQVAQLNGGSQNGPC